MKGSSFRHSIYVPLRLLLACEKAPVPIIEVHFGTTKWLWDSPLPASDYIADFHRNIPVAAEKCGVTLLGANGGITDGGEAAYFLPQQNIEAAQACLKRNLPQGRFGLIEQGEWEGWKKTDPSFPVALDSIPKPVEIPLP